MKELNLKTKAAEKFGAFKAKFSNFVAVHPTGAKFAVGTAVSTGMAWNTFLSTALAASTSAADKIQDGAGEILGLVTTIMMIAGIIVLIMGIWSWFNTLSDEDSGRQGKATVKIFIGLGLILIKIITYFVVKAVDSDAADTYMSDWA